MGDGQTQFGTLQIAIDGPAGAGKSSVARRLAEALGYIYIDTGAMYRAATWLTRKKQARPQGRRGKLPGWPPKAVKSSSNPPTKPSEGRIRVFVDGQEVTKEIRSREITEWASPVSALAPLRTVLVRKQQLLAVRWPGRARRPDDIGTVVLPNAGLKIFLTASPEVRARRCLIYLESQGESASFEELLQAVNERDHRDSTRDVSPLTKAADAIELSTDDLSEDQVVATVMEMVKSRLAKSQSNQALA